MAKQAGYQWVYSPRKAAPPKISETLKATVKAKADALVESYLKPTYIKQREPGYQSNYISNLYTKWYRSYFYFCAEYTCPGPNALSPTFESRFARLTYTGADSFTLSFMRYTEQWVELYHEQTLDECLKAIQAGDWFHP